MHVALLFHRLGPYHAARLEAAAQRCEVTAIELSAETGEYAWDKVEAAKNFRRVTLFPESDSRNAQPREVQARVSRALSDCHPEVVAVPGWSDPGALAALDWCLRSHVPAVLMSESTAHDERRVWWKEFVKRRMVGLCATALVGGRAHASYLERLGFSAERIFAGYDVVDNEHFARSAKEVRGRRTESRSQRSEVRGQRSEISEQGWMAESGRAEAPYFLASARFIEKKNLRRLIEAYAAYREKATVAPSTALWHLVLLGDGPLKSNLGSLIPDLSLTDSVVLPGFKQYDELPEYYARASAFVHASTSEQWGLVVNEALAAGLPVLVSNRCGCVPELVREGVNGFTFDPRSRSELADLMAQMAARTPEELARFGQASRGIVAHFGPAHFAEGLLQAAGLAVALPRRHAGAFDRLLLQHLIRR